MFKTNIKHHLRHNLSWSREFLKDITLFFDYLLVKIVYKKSCLFRDEQKMNEERTKLRTNFFAFL